MECVVGKRYKHYKNGKEYTVIAIGRLESDPSIECVVYRAEYTSPDYGAGQIWIRPRSVFEETVEYRGQRVSRFTPSESTRV